MGVSGGEPLLYPELPALLRNARSLGMLTTVTTNGMLLNSHYAQILKDRATLVAVSLDGKPESHNRIRGHPRAFEKMTAGVNCLKEAEVPFGFIFTLTLYNVHELAWVADYALAQGAKLLQVHPLEEVGRAKDAFSRGAPDRLELARTFLEIARLQEACAGRMKIHFDAADLAVLSEEPGRAYAIELCPEAQMNLERIPLANLIAPLVIEADGTIVPLQYNFGRAYQLGNIRMENLEADLQAWKRDVFPQFLGLCRNVHSRLLDHDPSEFPFVNWYSEVLEQSFGRSAQVQREVQPVTATA
jgi:MoaA/NifB/PqqE/SkfB family radical SAM enzyme